MVHYSLAQDANVDQVQRTIRRSLNRVTRRPFSTKRGSRAGENRYAHVKNLQFVFTHTTMYDRAGSPVSQKVYLLRRTATALLDRSHNVSHNSNLRSRRSVGCAWSSPDDPCAAVSRAARMLSHIIPVLRHVRCTSQRSKHLQSCGCSARAERAGALTGQ